MTHDTHSWLRRYYARLQQHPAFSQLSPSHRFARLVDAVASDHPSEAAELRRAPPDAQGSLLHWLTQPVEGCRAHERETLWTVRKGQRELHCVAVSLPTGVDVRLIEGGDFHRTHLLRDAAAAKVHAAGWLGALEARGWSSVDTPLSLLRPAEIVGVEQT
jgi:hypothetical protein